MRPSKTLAAALGGPLPETPSDPLRVVEELARAVEPGVVATAGGRYFGYVIGGALPATVGADWLTTVWDQCAGLGALGPSASVAEVIVGDWLKELLGLPPDASFAITTGCQMAHVTALAAARHDVLAARDWDVRERGLAGSPPITVVVGSPPARDDRPCPPAARDRRLADRRRAGRRRGPHAPGRARDRPRCERRADHRLRAGRRGEHGLVRPVRRDRRDRARDGRVAPRRRRVRPVGGGEPDAAPLARRLRRRRLVGDRRAQVAERPVRLRPRVLRASPTRTARR